MPAMRPAFPALPLPVAGARANRARRGWALLPWALLPAVASDAINFADVTSCGTNTEVSLPCMFSPDGREGYDKARLANSESLLHVLEHAGVHTTWRDNQSGCKGVCTGLAYEAMHTVSAAGCGAHECHDEVLLSGLDAAIDRWPGDQVIVLHQIGTHGPAYYRRVPARLRRFAPTCDSDDLLGDTIALLARRGDRDSALVYVSDHGESLGENGLYLRGLPYAIAPDTQNRVPMLAWLSPGMAAARQLDHACLRRRAHSPASHDHLFHSVLGLLEVRTALYDRRHDVFSECVA